MPLWRLQTEYLTPQGHFLFTQKYHDTLQND